MLMRSWIKPAAAAAVMLASSCTPPPPPSPEQAALSAYVEAVLVAHPLPYDLTPQATAGCASILTGFPGDGLFALPDAQCFNAGETGYAIYDGAWAGDDRPGDGSLRWFLGSNENRTSIDLGEEEIGECSGPGPVPATCNVGKPGDRFILGDSRKPYFAGNGANVVTPDADDDFVHINRFDIDNAVIQLHGSPEQYSLVDATYRIPADSPFNPGAEWEGAGIVFLGPDGASRDLIGWVNDFRPAEFPGGLAGPRFDYATEPSSAPGVTDGWRSSTNTANQLNSIEYVTSDPDGNAYLIAANGSRPFPGAAGAGRVTVRKVLADGSVAWTRSHLDDVTGALAFDATTDGESLYLCLTVKLKGVSGSDANRGRLMKLDLATGAATGTVDITHGDWNTCAGVTVDNAHSVYVTGEYEEDRPVPFIEKFDRTDLSPEWKRDVFPRPYGRLLAEAWGTIRFAPTPGGVPGEGQVHAGGLLVAVVRRGIVAGCPGADAALCDACRPRWRHVGGLPAGVRRGDAGQRLPVAVGARRR